jgi:hypothetical protein
MQIAFGGVLSGLERCPAKVSYELPVLLHAQASRPGPRTWHAYTPYIGHSFYMVLDLCRLVDRPVHCLKVGVDV